MRPVRLAIDGVTITDHNGKPLRLVRDCELYYSIYADGAETPEPAYKRHQRLPLDPRYVRAMMIRYAGERGVEP